MDGTHFSLPVADSTSMPGAAVVRSRIGRAALLIAGGTCVTMGAIGVLVPGMPTTIFMIAAAYCFAKSSPRLEQRLLQHAWLGSGLRMFRDTGGMTLKAKMLAGASMWGGIVISAYVLSESPRMLGGVVVLGCVGTTVICTRVRTVSRSAADDTFLSGFAELLRQPW